jgi:hypothetical protein
MAVIRAARSWWLAPLKRWQSIPPAIRADTSSKCWSSIRQRWWQVEWWLEGGLGAVGEVLGVAWVVAWSWEGLTESFASHKVNVYFGVLNL